MMTRKAYSYKLYPTKGQAEKLQGTLDQCRTLYNAALQERRDVYECKVKRHPSYYDAETRKQLTNQHALTYEKQAGQLPDIKAVLPEYGEIYSQVLQDVLRRVDKTFAAFFRRVKLGQTPGYPRYKGAGAYDSMTYPQSGFSLATDNRVCLSKLGTIKVKFPKGKKAHPPIGKMKTCTLKREGPHWYMVVVCEVEQEAVYHPSEEAVGIDLGLLHFATLSTGETLENPRHYRRAEQQLQRLQQALSRTKRGSKRRKKAAQCVGKAHRKIRRQRADFLHKASRKLVNRYQTICFENLRVANMSRRPRPKQDEETGHYLPNGAGAKAGLNKSIQDAGWRQFVAYCTYKAANAGGRVVTVDPRGTSQRCSGCGATVPKMLEERWHRCACGTELDRDQNAACEILRLGLLALAAAHPSLAKAAQARTEPSEDAPLRSPRREPWGVVTALQPRGRPEPVALSPAWFPPEDGDT